MVDPVKGMINTAAINPTNSPDNLFASKNLFKIFVILNFFNYILTLTPAMIKFLFTFDALSYASPGINNP